jgi:GTPase Era involved in 16S rRNA processing/gas vesicle protein
MNASMASNPGVAPPPVVHSPMGNALMAAVQNALGTLGGLERHRARMGDGPVNLAKEVISDARRRIQRNELYVCVVGEKKVGKSTFLNAILGAPLLSTAVRECTGTVTIIRTGPQLAFRATFENGAVETLDSLFQDRSAQLKRMGTRSEAQVKTCEEQATRLPMELTLYQRTQTDGHQRLTALQAQVIEATQKYEQLCQELGAKQTEQTAFELKLKEDAKAIPYSFRKPTTWYDPIRWVGQKLQEKKAKPEWIAHLESVKQCAQSKKDLAAFRGSVQEALQSRTRLQTQVQETTSQLDQLAKSIAKTNARIEELPSRTAVRMQRRGRLRKAATDHEASRYEVFSSTIRELTDQEKRGPTVQRLEIWVPTARIPAGLAIIDTPGVNTDNEVNRNRAWEMIRREADGCIVLSDIQQTVSQSTRDFVRDVKGYLPHLILVLTKLDRALESAEFDGESAVEQIEEAKRIGEARFANEVGRSADDILSFAVSAQRALKNDDPVAAQRFLEDTTIMAEILRTERALIVASRCATTIVTVEQQIAEAQRQAELAYTKQITFLESNRIPDPTAFCREQMRKVHDDIENLAQEIVEAGTEMIDKHYDALGTSYLNEIMKCGSDDQLKTYLENVQSTLPAHLQRLNKAIQSDLAGPTIEAIKVLEEPLLHAIREKYQIVRNITGSAGAKISSSSLGVRSAMPNIDINLGGLVQDFQNTKLGGMAGGALAGAAIGSFVPVIGTILGGALGGVASLFFGPSFEDVRADCVRKFAAAMIEVKQTALRDYQNSQSQIERELRTAMEEALKKAIRTFSSWIDGIIRDEQQLIAKERADLQHLVALKEQMNASLRDLNRLTELARKQSRGLAI